MADETLEDVVARRRKEKLVVKELREHQEELEEQKADAIDCRSNVLATHFQRAAQQLPSVDRADQALIDAQIFHKLGVYSKRQADQLQTGLRTYDLKSYTDNLIVHMRRLQRRRESENEEDDEDIALNFYNIGRHVWSRWKRAPAMSFMYGNAPADESTKGMERKKPRRIKKGTNAVKPSEMHAAEMEQTETDKQVAEMKRELKKRGKCNFWKFVIDPNEQRGFTRSIENIFHSSFLIKENIALLDLQNEREPTIMYVERHANDGDGGGEGVRKNAQHIMGFDMEEWQRVIHEFNITECVFPSKTIESMEEQREQLGQMGLAEEEDDPDGTPTF